MDHIFRKQQSETQVDCAPASLGMFQRLLNWLAGLFQLAEEEQIEAGLYLGDQPYK